MRFANCLERTWLGLFLSLSLLAAAPARASEAPAPAEAAPAREAEPARPAEKAAEEEPPAEARPSDEFIKGELTSLGATKLILQDTRIGVRGGFTKIRNEFFLLLSPELDLRIGKFGLGLGAPAQIRLYDPNKGLLGGGILPDGAGGGFRIQDYDELSEITRVVRYLTYGKKEENFFLNLSTEAAATLGHGAAVRRYIANVDVDRGRLSGQLDAYGKYGGFEAFVGDVLRPDRLAGALVFVKPFGASKNLLLERLSLGFTYVADFSAPLELERDEAGRPVLGGDAPTTPKVARATAAQVMGVTVETKVVKNENVDIKPWVDVSKLFVPGPTLTDGTRLGDGGAGVTLGVLGRFNFWDRKHAVRAIAELRGFQGQFLPGYFDSVYEVQRYQFITGAADPLLEPKLAQLLRRDNALQGGYYLELQYAWIHRLALTAAYEDSTAVGGRNLVLHAEVPTNNWIKLFASAHRRSVTENLFLLAKQGASQLRADNTLFFAGARMKLLPILFVNARLYRAWQIDTSSSFKSYRNIDGFEVDLELGLEFNRKRE